MKIYRPLWEDGAFLAPQQFQQQARWDAHVADTVARMALAHPWGVLCAEFDEGALALSRLNATRLCVRFADGTLVDTDLADNLPPVCDLSAAGSDAVEVLLCLPLLSANGGNLDDGRDSARPRRWQSERVPRRALQSTLLDRCEQVYDTPLTVRNLCKPTLPAYPPAEDRFHWRVMSHLGSRFLNMMSSAEVLRGTLSLYNWRDDELNNRRLDAILDVRHHRIQRFEDGFLLRGLDVEVTLDSNGFTGEGDIHLFGELLNRFFALYADMNQFNQLTLIVQPEGKYIRWKENHSPRLPG